MFYLFHNYGYECSMATGTGVHSCMAIFFQLELVSGNGGLYIGERSI